MICFKIDNREHKLKNLLQDSIKHNNVSDTEVMLLNLECGDFIVQYDETPIIVIERKTLADLASSIRDHRYRLQKSKMIETYGRDKVMYIIEGVFDFTKDKPFYIEGMDKTSIISSIINTMIRDGIKVVNTNSIMDTCNFLVEITSRVSKDPLKYMNGGSLDASNSNEVPVSKGKVFSKEDLFLHQMSQVPGISSKTAKAFVSHFSNMCTFYSTLGPLNEEEKLKILKNITTEENNKTRRISSKVAENIVKYMF
jgi:ERCC4-type nuclease